MIPETELVPDFTFSGRVIFDQDVRHLRVTIGNTRSGETSSFSSTYRTTGELVLKARAFVESALAVGNFNLSSLGTAAAASGNAAESTAGMGAYQGTGIYFYSRTSEEKSMI
jgi:hypothetical protein